MPPCYKSEEFIASMFYPHIPDLNHGAVIDECEVAGIKLKDAVSIGRAIAYPVLNCRTDPVADNVPTYDWRANAKGSSIAFK